MGGDFFLVGGDIGNVQKVNNFLDYSMKKWFLKKKKRSSNLHFLPEIACWRAHIWKFSAFRADIYEFSGGSPCSCRGGILSICGYWVKTLHTPTTIGTMSTFTLCAPWTKIASSLYFAIFSSSFLSLPVYVGIEAHGKVNHCPLHSYTVNHHHIRPGYIHGYITAFVVWTFWSQQISYLSSALSLTGSGTHTNTPLLFKHYLPHSSQYTRKLTLMPFPVLPLTQLTTHTHQMSNWLTQSLHHTYHRPSGLIWYHRRTVCLARSPVQHKCSFSITTQLLYCHELGSACRGRYSGQKSEFHPHPHSGASWIPSPFFAAFWGVSRCFCIASSYLLQFVPI